ncbi:hypothetical protein BH11BAC4_BH11BAC4_13280 [soil metagenome]
MNKLYNQLLMAGKKLTFLFFGLCCTVISVAQSDPFAGTWYMQYQPDGKTPPIEVELKIASPERNQLYPAELKLHCDRFNTVFNLLLVKRNSRQLGIGSNKIVITENAFSIGNWTVYLNGNFDFGKDNKGNPFLSVSRIITKQYGLRMPDPKTFISSDATIAIELRNFLKDTEIQLKKINNENWHDPHADSILHSPALGKYYGMIDTVHVQTRDCNISFPGSKKTSNGVVSVIRNGNTVIDLADLSYKKPAEEIVLDTGLNIIVFFADNYGKSAASTGRLNLDFGKRKISLDFSDDKDVASSFIVARVYYYPPNEERSASENELSKLSPEYRTQNNDNVFYFPDEKRTNALKLRPIDSLQENTLLREAKLLGNVEVNSKQITMAVWDDAVEDGDSISLSINGKWIVQGLAVKKRPQFIVVTLEPGQNKITFIADNLGSIVPNTSVLEIIDGKKRRSFMIDTNLSQNNLVNIIYDLKPGE